MGGASPLDTARRSLSGAAVYPDGREAIERRAAEAAVPASDERVAAVGRERKRPARVSRAGLVTSRPDV